MQRKNKDAGQIRIYSKEKTPQALSYMSAKGLLNFCRGRKRDALHQTLFFFLEKDNNIHG